MQPFGVNPASVDSHRGYVDKMQFNFPLLSDPERTIATAYHALKDDGRGIQRTVYVIGRDGTVHFAQRGAPPAPSCCLPTSTPWGSRTASRSSRGKGSPQNPPPVT